MDITQEIKDFILLNTSKKSYYPHIKADWVGLEYVIDFDKQSQRLIDLAKYDLAIIKKRVENFNAIKDFRVGDRILLPDGQMVSMVHIWDDTIQTSNSAYTHMGSDGGTSCSGGLDTGLAKDQLILTDELYESTSWFFHQGISGGHRGVDFKTDFRVYKTKEGADLSGIPQIEALVKHNIKLKSETITRINGNGNPYTMHLPMITIIDNIQEYPKGDVVLSGLTFKSNGYNLKCQPMKIAEIDKLLSEHDFRGVFYNNGTYENDLFLYNEKFLSEHEIYRKLK